MHEETCRKNTICLYSGGKDSHLATCQLIDRGHRIHMVTFENGAGLAGHNAQNGADRIIKRYGQDKAQYLGLYSTAGIWREFFLPFYNLSPTEIQERFGQITVSQFNCLSYRSAMYVAAVKLARLHQINAIADGASSKQGFVIELPCMIEQFFLFFKELGIEFICPVVDLSDDWRLKNLLLCHGFVPKTIEQQCLIGCPIPAMPDENLQNATVKCFQDYIKPKAIELINDRQFCLLQGGEFV